MNLLGSHLEHLLVLLLGSQLEHHLGSQLGHLLGSQLELQLETLPFRILHILYLVPSFLQRTRVTAPRQIPNVRAAPSRLVHPHRFWFS